MSEQRDTLRQIKLRIAVLLARGREARARAERLVERGRALRDRCGEHCEDVSALIARGNRLTPPRTPLRPQHED